jgi:hypothetical protein
MANIDGPKYLGALVIDLTDVKDELVDLQPGDLRGARGPQEGIDEVFTELANAIPKYGDEAELHPAVYKRVVEATTTIAKLRAHEIALMKALEVCRESLGRLENNREDDLSAIGTKAENMATKGKKPELGAHFEKTIKYKAQIAEKAAETRKKNEEAKAEEAKNAPPAAPPNG